MARKTKVYWTDKEWDRLAELVWPMRRKDPVPALVVLVGAAMQQMPEARRRTLSAIHMGPLVDRLVAFDNKLMAGETEANRLRDQLKTAKEQVVTKADVLSSLTDGEILKQFGPRVMAGLLELLTTRAINSAPATTFAQPQPQKPTIRPPKVAIIGLRGNQIHDIRRKIGGGVDIVDMAQFTKKPQKADIYVVWTNYVSHGSYTHIPNPCLFSGGLDKMARFITAQLKKQEIAGSEA